MSAVITNGYAAKRAIIAHLQQVSTANRGQPGLGQADVSYAWGGGDQGNAAVKVFGGLVTFVHPGDEDLQDGVEVLVKEMATVSLHMRATITPPPDDGFQAVEELIEAIADDIADEVARNPRMAGGHSRVRIVDGLGDEEPLDGAIAGRLTIHIAVESYLQPA